MSRRIRMYPCCPYCRYDLTGQVRSWTASCPLRALCSECGREYDTAEAMKRMDYGPHWLFEHARAPGFWAFLDTSGLAFNPRMMWRVIGPGLPVRRGRLAVFAAVWSVLAMVCALLHVWVLRGGLYDAVFGRYWMEEVMGRSADSLGRVMVAVFVGGACIPAVFLPLIAGGFVRRRVGEGRWLRIVRGLVCTMPAVVVWMIAMFLAQLLCLVTIGLHGRGVWWHIALGVVAAGLPPVFLAWWWRVYLRAHFQVSLMRGEIAVMVGGAFATELVLIGVVGRAMG